VSIFDLAALKSELERAEVEPDDNVSVRRVYLGSVFALLPSGKYYTPYANSNVDPCMICRGTGHTLAKYACQICNGRGKRDIATIALTWHETLSQCVARLAKDYAINDDMTIDCPSCHGAGKRYNDCPHCGGTGSREAYLDQNWYDDAEEELATIGAFLTSGEGDPCDLFAVMSVEDNS